jgi:hypothetical protein
MAFPSMRVRLMEAMVMIGFKTKGLVEPIASVLIAILLAYGSLTGGSPGRIR